jgi:hypothetical protein
MFQSTLSVKAADPVTLDNGVRIDFEGILSGKTIRVSNVELVPISDPGTALRSDLLTNMTGSTVTKSCPLASTQPDACSRYVRLSDGTSVAWPYTLEPYTSAVVYTRLLNLTDADSDGVADSSDTCAGTAAGAIVNAKGCSL